MINNFFHNNLRTNLRLGFHYDMLNMVANELDLLLEKALYLELGNMVKRELNIELDLGLEK